MVCNYLEGMHDIREVRIFLLTRSFHEHDFFPQQLDDAELQACSLRRDLERAMASNRRLEDENNQLQREVDRARWSQQQVTGQ